MEGYFLVYRSLFLNDLWDDKPFAYGQAWIDLIGLANHKEGFIFVRGNMVKVLRGQVGWSCLKLAARWGWSRSKVTMFLNRLEIIEQIKQQKSKVTSIITIINYDKFQNIRQQNIQQKDNRKTTERQQKDTNKECKGMINNVNEVEVEQKNGDLDFIKSMKSQSAYAGIDVEIEYQKMKLWCQVNKKVPSQRRFVNWLNRAERPIVEPDEPNPLIWNEK